MQLNMIVPTDIALDEGGMGDDEVFNIKKIKQDESLEKLYSGDMSMADNLDDDDDDEDVNVDKNMKGRIREMDYVNMDSDEEYERDLEEQMDEAYTRYKQRRAEKDAKFRAKQARDEEDEWHGFDDKKEERDKKFDSDSNSDESDSGSSSDSDSDDSDSESDEEYQKPAAPKQKKPEIKKKTTNSLMNDLGEKTALSKKTESGLSTAASMFFDQDIFQDVALDELLEEDEEEEEESSDDEAFIKEQSRKRKRSQQDVDEQEEDSDFEIQATEDAVPDKEDIWDGKEDENSKAMKKAMGKMNTRQIEDQY